jgi:hypothetical protein
VEDFFCDRLVFPYWKGGQVVYFIARATQFTGDEEWERSKYKKLLTHSERHGYVSETVRNDTFYNEDSARGAEEVLITEGVTDCISAAQAGIACISPVTTRFRKQDVPKLLRLTRWAKRVVICNDAETSGAGAAGAEESASALHAEGRDVRIAELPRPEGVDKVDVNEFLKANSPEAFREVLAGARRYLEHLIEPIPADTPKIDLAAQIKPAMELIARRPAIEQDGYLDIITKRFKVGRRSVGAMLREARPEPAVKGTRDDGDAGHGGEVLKGEVFEEQDHYYVQGRDGEVLIISSFHIEPKERIRLGAGDLIVGDVTTDRGRVYEGVRFPPSAWHSKRNFIQSFPNADMQWTGSDDNVQGVLRILSGRQVPVRTGLEVVGYVETAGGPRWVTPAQVLARLNQLGGRHGIGRLDLVENRYVGMKSRGCYETPGGTIMLKAHRAIESITLDREVAHLKDDLMPRYASMIYNGYWWGPERIALQTLIDHTQQTVNGWVRVKLYKGNVIVVGRDSKTDSLFDPTIATFEDDKGAYDQKDAGGFIKLNALRMRIAANLKNRK